MRQPTILIVDDSEFILQLLQTVFDTEGFASRGALDGGAALASALGDPPDAVLLDVRMPEMDGWEVLRVLREETVTRKLPVVMMSTDDEGLGWTLSLGRGAQAYVMKPFSPSDLVDTLRQVIERGPRGLPPSAPPRLLSAQD